MRLARNLSVAAAAGLVVTAGAAAHVEVTPKQIIARKLTRSTFTVENERPQAATVKVAVKLPASLIVVRFEPKAGWKRATTTRRLAIPLRINGQTIRRRVDVVTWVARTPRAHFGPGHVSGAFSLRAVVRAPAGRTLAFRTVQTYSNGEIVRWIGATGSDRPAARVRVR